MRGLWSFLERGSVAGMIGAVVVGAGWSSPVGALAMSAPGLPCDVATPTIVGSSGPDVLLGTDGDDVIVGGAGADVVGGRGGADLICAGPNSSAS
jgi:Ca2+-binding RTX toxin-like protein